MMHLHKTFGSINCALNTPVCMRRINLGRHMHFDVWHTLVVDDMCIQRSIATSMLIVA